MTLPVDLVIISGGQTGADIAGVHAGRKLGLETGGWAPKGWLTSEGPQEQALKSYGLVEANTEPGASIARIYGDRTERNVRDSDATAIFAADFKSAGTKLTKKLIWKHRKPFYQQRLPPDSTGWDTLMLAQWIKNQWCPRCRKAKRKERCRKPCKFVLNVAGNRQGTGGHDIFSMVSWLLEGAVKRLRRKYEEGGDAAGNA